MEKGDKPKTNTKIKISRKKKSIKQTAQQNVNVKVNVGDQKKTPRKRAPRKKAPAKEIPITQPVPIIRNTGDALQTIVSYSRPPMSSAAPIGVSPTAPLSSSAPSALPTVTSPEVMEKPTTAPEKKHKKVAKERKKKIIITDPEESEIVILNEEGKEDVSTEFRPNTQLNELAGQDSEEEGLLETPSLKISLEAPYEEETFQNTKVGFGASRKVGGSGGGSTINNRLVERYPHLGNLHSINNQAYRRESDRIRKAVDQGRIPDFPARRDAISDIIIQAAQEFPPDGGWIHNPFMEIEQRGIGGGFITPAAVQQEESDSDEMLA